MTVAGWRSCRLGDLLEIKHGYAFRGEYFAAAGTHVVLTPGNFLDHGGFKDKADKEKWYCGPIPHDFVLNEGDVIVAMTEQAEGLLGSSAVIPRGGFYLHNQRLGLVQVRDQSAVDKLFLYYLFHSSPVRAQIRATATGTKVRHTAPSRIAEVRVDIPPLAVQRRITGILSAYDEMVENDLQRIRILENMARALYREWFVDRRFPENEGARRTDWPLGPVPEGWIPTTIGQAFTTVLGGTPSRANPQYWEGGTVPWINSGKVNDFRITEPSQRITELALRKSAAKLMPIGTTVVAITGATLGQVSYLEIATTANQSVVGIYDKSGELSEWIYLMLKERIGEIIKAASGGAQQHINKETVANVLCLVPDPTTTSRFRKLVRPLFEEIATLLRRSSNLRQARDLLLPRLLSGQVTLDEAA